MENIVDALIEIGYNPDEAERMADRARKNKTMHVLREYIKLRGLVSDELDFDACFMLSY